MSPSVSAALHTCCMPKPGAHLRLPSGNVLPPGGGATVARMGALWAGLPNTTAVNTLNRQCSSGLATCNQIANQIAMGQIDIGIGEQQRLVCALRVS
jgi:acetyl-CoA acyltransferase 1